MPHQPLFSDVRSLSGEQTILQFICACLFTCCRHRHRRRLLNHSQTLLHKFTNMPTLTLAKICLSSACSCDAHSFHFASLWNITKLVLKNRQIHSLTHSVAYDNTLVQQNIWNSYRKCSRTKFGKHFSKLHFRTVMNLIILYLVGVIIVLKKSFILVFFWTRDFFFLLLWTEAGQLFGWSLVCEWHGIQHWTKCTPCSNFSLINKFPSYFIVCLNGMLASKNALDISPK